MEDFLFQLNFNNCILYKQFELQFIFLIKKKKKKKKKKKLNKIKMKKIKK